MGKVFRIRGIDNSDVNNIANKLSVRGFSTIRIRETFIDVINDWDAYDRDLSGTMCTIAAVIKSENYDYHRFFSGEGSDFYAIYDCSKRYNSLYEDRLKVQLNSFYGAYVDTDTAALRQSYDNYYKSKYHGGYKKRHGDIYKVNAIYNGIERATSKFKTIVKWSDGTKTIVTSQNDNHLNHTLAFAYAWVKRQYGSNSAFKRHVDKYVENWGYMGQIFFNDGDYQAQLSVRTKSHDIYDQVALVMTMKDFGGIDKVADILEEKTFNE